MLKRKLCSLLAACSLLLGLAACSQNGDENSSTTSSQPSAYPVTVREVTVNEKPEAVISLSPSLTEMICDLGYQDQLAGVSDYCDFPSTVAALPQCGTNTLVDLEAIAALSPDLILSQAAFSESDLRALQQTGAKIIILPRATNFDELKKLYSDLGVLLEGSLTGADSAEEKYDARYNEIVELSGKLTDEQKGQSAAYLRMLDWTVATGDTFENQVLSLLGFENVAKAYGDWQYPQENAESFTPDVLFYNSEITEEELLESDVYQALPAVTEGHAYPVEAVALERQTFRMFDELKKMLESAYPTLSE